MISKMKSLRWATLIQGALTRREDEDTHTQREDHLKSQGEGGHLHTIERSQALLTL